MVKRAEEIKGAGIGLLGLEHPVGLDVEPRGLEQGEPLGLVAPAHRPLPDQVPQFVEARVAGDAQE